MKSSTRTWLSHARTALVVATLVVLGWNLASFGALVNGREAFARALEEGGLPAEARVGTLLSWLVLACIVEIASVSAGIVSYGTRGNARLQAGAAALVALLSGTALFALPVFDADPRTLHEVARRSLGTAGAAALPILWLGGLSLLAFQAVEASWPERHGKLATLGGFLVGLTVFALGLRALVPLLSGAPVLSS